jgi:hypothetical protein
MWRKLLSLGLVFGLLSAQCWASPLPASASSPSSGSVTLSAEEYAQVEQAIIQAQEALKASNEKIQAQSRLLTTLWLFSGALVLVAGLEATAIIVVGSRK